MSSRSLPLRCARRRIGHRIEPAPDEPQDREAEQLIASIKFGTGTDSEIYNDAMTRDALLLFVSSRHFPERVRRIPAEGIPRIPEKV